ncbi:MAG: hypothetical protein WD273_04755 [Trueperaceae bacterium]
MTNPRELFRVDDLPDELAELLKVELVWQALERLDSFAQGVTDRIAGDVHPTAIINGPLFMAEGAEVAPYAMIDGPVWLGPGAFVGHGAFLRGPAVLMAGARVGHASEVKRSILLPGARAPHFNYVGDSILGHEVNLGAGVKIANFKTFGDEIRMDDQPTGLKKLGAAVGDGVSIGCNAVLSPGTVIGARCIIYNGALVRGTIPADTVVKARLEHEQSPLTHRH